ETVSQHLEGLIIKGLQKDDYVTIAEALAILDYVLKNETGHYIYSYFVCDEMGEVERLGLAEDILTQIPLDAEALPQGEIGNAPKSFLDVFLGFLLEVFTFVLLVAFGPILLAAALTIALVLIGLEWLGPLFELFVLLIIKIIIIIFVFIMFALALLTTLLSFIIIAIIISIVAIVTNQHVSWGFLFVEFNLWGLEGKYEVSIGWEDNAFLGIPIPLIISGFILGDELLWETADSPGLGGTSTSGSLATLDEESTTPSTKITLDAPLDDEGDPMPILAPQEGNSGTEYLFRIRYKHEDGVAPEHVLLRLYRNNEPIGPFTMILEDDEPNYAEGCVYYLAVKNIVPGIYTYDILAWQGADYSYYEPDNENDGPFVNGAHQSYSVIVTSLYVILAGAIVACGLFNFVKNGWVAAIILAATIFTMLTPLFTSSGLTPQEKTLGFGTAGVCCAIIFLILLVFLLKRGFTKYWGEETRANLKLIVVEIFLSIITTILGYTTFSSDDIGYLVTINIILTGLDVFLMFIFPYVAAITVSYLFGKKKENTPKIGGATKGIFIAFIFVYLLMAIVYIALSLTQ
ncbi:MAG: hypothetical protein ACTSQ8_24185, partial [Candidatus Helarchaeota archaeon]